MFIEIVDNQTNVSMRKNAVVSLIWRLAERFSAQGIGFLVSIILARTIDPSIYGNIAVVLVLISILQVFIDSGLSNSLIQKKTADNEDFSTVFFFNLFSCIVAYISVWIFAPVIAKFYGNDQLTVIVRVMGLTLLVSGLKNTQQAYITRNMLFKKFFFATIIGTILSAISGIYLAFKGYGIWALVTQHVVNITVDTVLLWFLVKWRPKLVFSITKLKKHVKFGFSILASRLIDVIYTNSRQLILGKVYSLTDLAYFNRGAHIPSIVVTNINSSLDSILFPVMARAQDRKQSVKNITKRAIEMGSFLLWPVMVLIIVTAESLIIVLLTDKWIMSVPYLRLFCVYYAMYPLHTPNLNAIMAVGRSAYFVKMEYVKKTIGVIILIATVRMGVLPLAVGICVEGVITTYINAFPNKWLIDYSYVEQLKDIIPNLILALLMGAISYLISFSGLEVYLLLPVQISVGFCAYIILAFLTGNKNLKYTNEVIMGIIRNSDNTVER